MELWLIEALVVAGGLIIVVGATELFVPKSRPRRSDGPRRHGPVVVVTGEAAAHPAPHSETDWALHRKLDYLLERLGRPASIWTKFGWGAIGFTLTFLADHFLAWWFGIC